MLNKARIDTPALGQYEPMRDKLLRQSWRSRLTALCTTILSGTNLRLAVMALLLGRAVVFGDLAPFGLAFFITVRWFMPGKSLMTAGLLAVGALARGPGAMVGLLGSIGIYMSLERVLLGKRLNHMLTGAMLAMLSCLLVKFPVFLVQAPSLFDLTSTALEAGLVAVLLLVFNQSGKVLLSAENAGVAGEQTLALSLTLAAMLTGFEGVLVYGIPLKAVAACYFVMVGAYVGGPGLGAAAGATIGVVLNLSNPALLGQVGLYAFSGLLAGLFKDMRKVGVGLSFTMALLMLTVYGSQPGDLRILTYEVVAAFALFLVTGRKLAAWVGPHLNMKATTIAAAESERHSLKMQQLVGNRLKELGGVFSQLAETFGEKDDDESFLVEKNFTALMDHIVTDVCEKCVHFQDCWQKDFYKSYHTMLNMLALADAHGELDPSKIPEALRSRCTRPTELVTCANYLVKVYKVNLYWQRKMHESRTLVASQLKGVAGIMQSMARDMRMDAEYQSELAEEIKQEIAALKLFVPQVEVYRRQDRVDVVLHKPACSGDHSQCTDDLIPLVSNLVGRPVSKVHSRCPQASGKGKCTLCLSTAEPLHVASGIAQVCRAGSGVSGDTVSVRGLPNGKLAVILSDGMGNGPEANRESRATVAVLEQLLRSGFNQETAVQTINSVLMLRSSRETFATVDMAVIDLYTGIAELTKIGATAAFLKRGDHIECVRSSSLPAGILHKIDVDSYRVSLQPGDMLVMLSDGVLDSQKDIADKEEWFMRVLRQTNLEDPEALTKYLIDRANANARGKALDDMSVVAVRVTKRATSIPLVS